MRENNFISFKLTKVCSYIFIILWGFFVASACTDEADDIGPITVTPVDTTSKPAPTPPPVDPEPATPTPTDPVPSTPAPTEPTPTTPAPAEPAPTQPAPTEPAPTQPVPTNPAPTQPTPKYLVLESTFEESNALSKWQSEQASPSSITRVNNVAKAGSYSAKFVINKTDKLVAGSYRAELKHDILPKNAERWYGMSVYLPSSYTVDRVPESIFQWHNVPNFKAGEDWGNYKFQNPWRLETNNGRFRFVHQYSSVASDPKSPVRSKAYDLGEYKTGEWTDWVVHFKATHTSDGILEIWKNGTKVLTINGPVYYNDETGPYFKMGIYKWGWSGNESSVSTRTLYFDEVRVGSEKSSFQEVAPRSNR